MRHDDTSSGWEIGEQVSYCQAEPAQPGGLSASQEPGASPVSQIPVLARLPNLDSPQPSRRRTRRPRSGPKSDGRIITQGLSMKLLGGGALLLVGIAVVPWLLGGRKDKPQETETVGAPEWGEGETDTLAAEAPPFGTGDPVSETPLRELAEPDWPTPVPPSDTADAPAWPQMPETPVAQVPPHDPGQQSPGTQSQLPRGQPQPAGSTRQPELAGPQYRPPTQAVAPHLQPATPDTMGRPAAWAMRPMQLGPAGEAPNDPPGVNTAPGYEESPPGANYPSPGVPAAPQGPANWQLPPRDDVAPRAGLGASGYGQPPLATIPAPRPEPGVARLQGVIETPPVRTTYDRARSGIY
jgi:hypothetical protein